MSIFKTSTNVRIKWGFISTRNPKLGFSPSSQIDQALLY